MTNEQDVKDSHDRKSKKSGIESNVAGERNRAVLRDRRNKRNW